MMLGELCVEGVLPTTDKINLMEQPPNSPDLNILDLGLFNAIQASYEKCAPRDSLQLIRCVDRSWRLYPSRKINWLFLSLQMVFNEIIEHHGGNDFKLPHMNKFKLERMSKLPVSLMVHPQAYSYLNGMCDPDCEGPDFEDDDLPLPGTISRYEVKQLLLEAKDGE